MEMVTHAIFQNGCFFSATNGKRYFGAICWCAEQVHSTLWKWNIDPEAKTEIGNLILRISLPVNDPRPIFHVYDKCVPVLNQCFDKAVYVTKIILPAHPELFLCVHSLPFNRLYFITFPDEATTINGALIFHGDKDGNVCLTYIRSQEQGSKFLSTFNLNPKERKNVEQVLKRLPISRSDSDSPQTVSGDLIKLLLLRQIEFERFNALLNPADKN